MGDVAPALDPFTIPDPATTAALSDEELIRRALAAKNGEKFRRLWAGDTTGYQNDDSRADLALCGLLAYWTGSDPSRIDRLFRKSKLMRPKWDERRGHGTYGQHTIAVALANRAEFCGTRPPQRNSSGRCTAQTPATARVSTRPRVRPLPPFKPFPLHCLPPILSDVVRVAADAIGCDPALTVAPTLAAVAGCIGNARAVLLKGGWSEPAVIWAVTVADSGGHKSPAYRAVVKPLTDLQCDVYDRHKADMEEHKEARKEWKASKPDDRGPEPEAPAPPLTFATSDTTIEALAEDLESNAHGLFLARDELDGWFQSFTRYRSGGGSTDRPQWLELHSAGTLLVRRKTAERCRMSVRRAAVSITGTIQPAILANALDRDALQAGLGARFLLAMPPGRRRLWTENELPEDLSARYTELLDALLGLSLADVEKRKPHMIRLSPGARALWIDFYNEWGGVQFEAEGEQAAAFAKIEAYAPRLMLLHHVVAHVAAGMSDLTPITESSAAVGIEMARWFAAEVVRVYLMLGESSDERDGRRLVDLIRARGGAITARKLMRSNSRRYPDTESAESALSALVGSGQARWIELPAKMKGRPVRAVELCMTHDTHDTDDDAEDEDHDVDDGAAHDTVP
jgi:hypothetical protein